MAEPKEVVRERERRCWELRQQGWTLRRIAAAVGIDDGTVCRILARVERRLAKEFAGQAEGLKARQTAILEHIADEALQAWEKSKESQKTVTRRTAAGGSAGDEEGAGSGGEESTTQQARTRDGNTAYLTSAMTALAEVRKIWGAEAPRKTELTGKDGKDLIPDRIRTIEIIRPPAAAEAPPAETPGDGG